MKTACGLVKTARENRNSMFQSKKLKTIWDLAKIDENRLVFHSRGVARKEKKQNGELGLQLLYDLVPRRRGWIELPPRDGARKKGLSGLF